MEAQKNLCAQIPLSLHAEVREEQGKSGQSLSEYITQLLLNYYERGEKSMNFVKTLALQIPESLYNRIKGHLEREKKRTGKRLSQKDFVIGLIERELDEAERREDESHADVG